MILTKVMLLLAVAATATQELKDHRMVTVCIVDVSSSMDGGRLATAKKELLDFAEQAPPSKDHVVILVPFHSTAVPPSEYTEKEKFVKAVKALTTLGGTNIASGLKAGRIAATNYSDADHLLVMLYSDGEGADPAQMAIEEAKLSQLFTDRHAKALSNHVSLKRWGNANMSLRTLLEKNPAVAVTDAATMGIRPVAVRPVFKVARVTRSDADPQYLEITVEAGITSTLSTDKSLVAIDATCTNPGCEGDVTSTLTANGAIRTLRIRVPVALRQQKSGKFNLNFSLAPSDVKKGDSSIVLPLLKSTKITLSVMTPPLDASVIVDNRLEILGATRWDDPVAGTAIIEATLTTNRADDKDNPGSGTITSSLVPKAGIKIVSGPAEIAIPSPGEQKHRLEFSVPKRPGSDPPVFDLVFDTNSRSSSPFTKVKPPVANWEQRDIPAPPPVEVPIKINTGTVSQAKWVRLPDLFYFEAHLMVDVAGQIPNSTAMLLSAPANIRKLTVTPEQLRSGKQNVKLRFWAEYAPEQFSNTVTLGVSTQSPDKHQIQLKCPPSVEIASPEPAQVGLANAAKNRTIRVADNATQVGIPVQFTVDQRIDPRAAATVKCEGFMGSVSNGGRQLFPLFRPGSFQAPLPNEPGLSFFHSTAHEILLQVEPVPASPKIKSTQITIRIIRRPPFVRYLLYFTCGFAPLLIVSMIAWVARRFLTPETLAQSKTE